jgi:hypothetical protein
VDNDERNTETRPIRYIDKENEYKSTIERRYAGEGVYWCFHRSETESTIFGYSESVIT